SKQPTDEPKSTQPKEESKPGTEQKDKPSQGTKAVPPWKGPVDYSSVPNPKNTGPGLKYTDPTHKARILEHNRKANGGLLRSDIDGTILDPPQRAVGGAPKNMN